jgi:hypothetical protein
MVLCVRVLARTEGLGGRALVGGVLHTTSLKSSRILEASRGWKVLQLILK